MNTPPRSPQRPAQTPRPAAPRERPLPPPLPTPWSAPGGTVSWLHLGLVFMLTLTLWRCSGCCEGEETLDAPATASETQCAADRDCPGDEVCEGGQCAAPTTPRDKPKRRARPAPVSTAQPFTKQEEAAVGSACTKHLDCVGELICEDGACVKPPECRKDADCPKNLTCDTSMGRCRDPICVVDEDCPSNICVYGQCRDEAPGCRGYDCPPDHFCIPESGECEPQFCKSDDDCADGRLCDGRSCRLCLKDDQCPGNQTCYAIDGICREPETCADDQDCLGRRVCNPETKKCDPEPCESDQFGANNKRETASPIQEGTFSATLCEGESDWFVIDMKEGDGIQIHLMFDKNFGGMEGRFYQPNDQLEMDRWVDNWGAGSSSGFHEKTAFNGPHYIRFKHTWGQSLPYRFRIDFIPGGRCINDRHEPNNSIDEALAAPVNAPRVMRVCPEDDDWFKVEVKPGQLVQTHAFVLQGELPTVVLYRKSGNGKPVPIEQTPPGIKGVETPKLNYTNTTDKPEDLFVRVFFDDPEANNQYRLHVIKPDELEQLLKDPNAPAPDQYLPQETTPLKDFPKVEIKPKRTTPKRDAPTPAP